MDNEKLKAEEDAHKELLRIIDRCTSLESLCAEYVRIDNSLKVEADSDNDYKYYYFKEIKDSLSKIIVRHYLKTLGYYENSGDTFKRWERA